MGWGWNEDSEFDDAWGDDAESRAEFADDGWSGDEGMLGTAAGFDGLDFWDRDGDSGDGDFERLDFMGELAEAERIQSANLHSDELPDAGIDADSFERGYDAGWNDGWDADELPDHASYEDHHHEQHSVHADLFDEDGHITQEGAEAIGGEGSRGWSWDHDEGPTDEQIDEIREAINEFNPDGDPDWGVPQHVLDDPLWEQAERDQGTYYDLGDMEDGRGFSGIDPDQPLGKWGDSTPDEDLIAMKEELLEIELENAQEQNQQNDEGTTLPGDGDDRRADDEDDQTGEGPDDNATWRPPWMR